MSKCLAGLLGAPVIQTINVQKIALLQRVPDRFPEIFLRASGFQGLRPFTQLDRLTYTIANKSLEAAIALGPTPNELANF